MLRVSNIKKVYGDVVVLGNVSFVLNAGERVGLIGPNGCGKSTLLRILIGEEAFDEGSVQFTPPDLKVGYLAQGEYGAETQKIGEFLHVGESALSAAEARVASLSAALPGAEDDERVQLLEAYAEALTALESLALVERGEHEALGALQALGLGNLSLNTPLMHLSGGQRTRLGLARIWLERPQLILLDEPTNHLDLEALSWLEGWLRVYNGAMLVVSHDRTFLDNTVTKILDLDPETLTVTEYVGNYTDYLQTWEREREKQWSQWRAEQAEVRRLHQDIVRTRNQALWVEATTKPGQPAVRRIAKKVAKKAKSREKKLERYQGNEERAEKPTLSWRMKLEFVDTPESGRDVLTLKNLAAGYGSVKLFQHVNARLRAGEWVVLVGSNGVGKTTLLRVIMGALSPMEGNVALGANVQVGYYAQGQEVLDSDSTPFDTLRAVAAMSETEVRSFLHYFLFAGDEVFVPVQALSYGERARLALARLVAMGCNFLVLDEPINHLDIPSRTQFERAMANFEGTVLAVVHDRYFIRQFATRIWTFEGGTLRSYIDLEDLARGRKVGGSAVPA